MRQLCCYYVDGTKLLFMMHACLLCMYTADIKLKSWLKEIVGTTVMRSSVLNFHQPKKPLPKKGVYKFLSVSYIVSEAELVLCMCT